MLTRIQAPQGPVRTCHRTHEQRYIASYQRIAQTWSIRMYSQFSLDSGVSYASVGGNFAFLHKDFVMVSLVTES